MTIPGRASALFILLGLLASTVPRAQVLAARGAPLARVAASRVAAPVGSIIAVALHGDIYVLRADGSARHRLTTSGRASAPQLSPDGRLVAYFEAAPGQPAQTGNSAGAAYVLPVSAPAGTPAQRLGGKDITRDDAHFSWSPDSSRVAYVRGNTALVIDSLRGRKGEMILRPPRGMAFAGAVAWTPDGHRFAVPVASSALQTLSQTLQVVIGTPLGARWARITVRFPPGALGRNAANLPESVPNSDLTWTPDGQGFLFSTTVNGEGPPDITGVWRVGAGGGIARLVIGSPPGARTGRQPPGSGLNQATHFLLSPDRMRLATDSLQGLWIATATGHAGHFLPVSVPRFCVLAQYVWLPDSSGLTFVQACPTGQSVLTRMTLFSVRLDGSAPRQLYRATSSDQQVIDLGPSYRCVLCGY